MIQESEQVDSLMILVIGSSLGSAAQKFQLGKNAKKEIVYRGTGNAFLIEIPHLTTNINGHGHEHLELHENGLAEPGCGSPSSKEQTPKRTWAGYTFCISLPDFSCIQVARSQKEAFFDIDNNFNNDSDDDFMSSCSEFPASNGKSLSYPTNDTPSNRPALSTLQAEMSKVDDWMAGTLKEVGSLHSPPPEDKPKSSPPPFDARNGIAALAGNAQHNLKSTDNPLYEASSRKGFPSSATEEKVMTTQPRWERVVTEKQRDLSLQSSEMSNLCVFLSQFLGGVTLIDVFSFTCVSAIFGIMAAYIVHDLKDHADSLPTGFLSGQYQI